MGQHLWSTMSWILMLFLKKIKKKRRSIISVLDLDPNLFAGSKSVSSKNLRIQIWQKFVIKKLWIQHFLKRICGLIEISSYENLSLICRSWKSDPVPNKIVQIGNPFILPVPLLAVMWKTLLNFPFVVKFKSLDLDPHVESSTKT